MNNQAKHEASESVLTFRIILSAVVCGVGGMTLLADIRLGGIILGGGVLGLIGNLWAYRHRESPWVHGLKNPTIVPPRDKRFNEAAEYQRLLKSGLIAKEDYDAAMGKLYPLLRRKTNNAEQDVPPNA